MCILKNGLRERGEGATENEMIGWHLRLNDLSLSSFGR